MKLAEDGAEPESTEKSLATCGKEKEHNML